MSDLADISSSRVLKQKSNREKQKNNYEHVVLSDNDSDSDSTIYEDYDDKNEVTNNEVSMEVTDYLTEEFHENNYNPDNHDIPDTESEDLGECENSPPLYDNANITVYEAVSLLMKFFNQANFDKKKVISMMRLIKRLLPCSNKLPVTFRQILQLYGKKPCSIEKYYCNNCFSSTTKKGAQHYCDNVRCKFYNTQLSKRELTEIVTINIREKLQSIIARNYSLFNNYKDLLSSFDIQNSVRYRTKTQTIRYPITLVIHADGAPLIRSTKSAVWPCFASIVELPPPVREYKANILTLGLWVSNMKPNVDIFLKEIIEQLLDLSKNGTTIFVDENEIKLNVKTQYFVSDLPAKSLFMKTINFNGYFACTNCITEGNFRELDT